MFITKFIESRIDINNVNDQFCRNYDEMILGKLEAQFKNRCYAGIFITDIVRVVRRSEQNAKCKVLDGSTYVDVLFEAAGVVYEQGEVLHGCKIIQINNNGLTHAKTDHTVICVRNPDTGTFYSENEIVPVIVNKIRASPFAREITISAWPFVPMKPDLLAFSIAHGTEKIDYGSSNKLCADLVSEIADIKKQLFPKTDNQKKVYKFFKDLLYPHGKVTVLSVMARADKFTLMDIDRLFDMDEKSAQKIANSILMFPDSYLDNDQICVFGNTVRYAGRELSPVELPFESVVVKILHLHKKALITLLGFVTNYDTLQKIKDSQHIWKTYTMLKT